MKKGQGRLDPPLLVPTASFSNSQDKHHDRYTVQQGLAPYRSENEFEQKAQHQLNVALSTKEEGTQPTCSAINDDIAPYGSYSLNDSWGLLLSESVSLKCTLQKTTVTVGRDQSCDIVLDDPRVSQLHFSVMVEVEVDIAVSSHELNAKGEETHAQTTSEIFEPFSLHKEENLGLKTEVETLIGCDQCEYGSDGDNIPVVSTISVESHNYNNANNSLCAHVGNGKPSNAVDPFNKVEDQDSLAQPMCKMKSKEDSKLKFRVFLTDHSTNGTFVNDIRVGKGRRIELQTGFDIAIVQLHENRNHNIEDASNDWREDEDCVENNERPRYRENDANVEDSDEAPRNASEARNSSANKLWNITNAPSYLEHFFFHLYPTPKPLPVASSPLEPSVPPEFGMESEEKNTKTTEVEKRSHNAELCREWITPGKDTLQNRLALNIISSESALQQGAVVSKQASSETFELPTQIMGSVMETMVPHSGPGLAEATNHPPGNFFIPITAVSDLPHLFNRSPPASVPTSEMMIRPFVGPPLQENLIEGATLPLHNSRQCCSPNYVIMPLRKIQWGSLIGSGSNSDVYMGIDILSGMTLAIKVLKQTKSPCATLVNPGDISSPLSCYTDAAFRDFEDGNKAKDCKYVDPEDAHKNVRRKDQYEQSSASCSSVDCKECSCEVHKRRKITKETRREEVIVSPPLWYERGRCY